MPLVLKDRFGRIHDYLRISLTDRCNLNCIYCCNPQLPKSLKPDKKEILNFDELLRVVRIFTESLGIRKVRFTGGEPMLRKDIMKFFEALSPLKKRTGFEFAVTTNGTLLEGNIEALKSAGLDRINISLDSLRSEVFKYITGSDKLSEVLKNINGLEETGFQNIKINSVVMRNINDSEAAEFADFFRNRNITVRFIEFMPFENNGWTRETFVSSEEVKKNIEKHFHLEKIEDKSQIAQLYRMTGYKAKIGFISPVSQHFCSECNRLRLKANGRLKLCLFDPAQREIDLRDVLRDEGSSDLDIITIISESLSLKEREHPEVSTLALENRNSMQNIGG
ncbi:MAG TPA: GTP 3',8-cyclase MoaA [Ignavibacteriales bacterium]|nr:GTP 3',8-cyclase MoaA [Ignavibacteriales bacterium]